MAIRPYNIQELKYNPSAKNEQGLMTAHKQQQSRTKVNFSLSGNTDFRWPCHSLPAIGSQSVWPQDNSNIAEILQRLRSFSYNISVEVEQCRWCAIIRYGQEEEKSFHFFFSFQMPFNSVAGLEEGWVKWIEDSTRTIYLVVAMHRKSPRALVVMGIPLFYNFPWIHFVRGIIKFVYIPFAFPFLGQ